ncbi:ATP-dependent helicase HrpB [Erwinia sp. OLTSP20]|uniref:ATP-dependent helicase HrpB n=1 Tax=unclassified Erwinia TaxID=2622719 RepID=UPI000C194E31|nr:MULTISPECIES: ATP-dependent helicase HrpB [unclassified Erwinia]PIJ49799.1 ATP-dependent helicase HrpB [Erwinia sp. OAMSP11]PIJ70899.1 ATP-dependent helicase HrpB [Erwinia sp. OLSSP12]PIJ80264.1 ATP-dependent helicase HrpB [Erwinia sp. OLCASP19]PIJ82388.1 ATP-dependent helicase HrpB [Erwinia sp. OLMTSP26]PIJ85074.1 ATP-dependent helicase HrpB [Erwinia sp. OLMDSP33]
MSVLPVSEVLSDVLQALEQHNQVLLAAPTGAGKSTWLPLQLLQQATLAGRIIMLEPRRLAARNVAQRLAEQLGQSPGGTVGYRMRGERAIGATTRLEVVTEGILTRMLQRDPMLEGVSLVILDEFHERSLQADMALALLLDVQRGLRDDLKILLMSATLDNSRLQAMLPEAPLIVSAGRSWPVARRYVPLDPGQSFEQNVTRQACQLLNDEPGSLLLFLPGVAEIRRVERALQTRLGQAVDICPLYGALPLAEQRKAIVAAPAGRRKVVLATNIAETSLTIEGIRLVLDSAQERVALFEPRSGLTRLQTQRISQASMTQRAGRAGRLSPGVCVHLISAEQAERAAGHNEPEILHSDLSAFWLELLQWGCHRVQDLCWLDTPPENNLQAARQLLRQLAATDEHHHLSHKGRRMALPGTEPRLAALLVTAAEQSAEVRMTAALLVAILEDPPRSTRGDLLDAFCHPQPHWQRRARQLAGDAAGASVDVGAIAPLLATAFADRLARRRANDGRYLLANGSGAALEPDAPLGRYEWLFALGLLLHDGQPDARLLLGFGVDIDRLIAQQPDLLQTQTQVEWDDARATLRAWQRQQIGQLVLRSRPLPQPEPALLHQAILRWIERRGLAVLPWSSAAQQLRIRLLCAHRWLPEQNWPSMTDADLLASLQHWLLPSMTGVKDMKGLLALDLHQALLHLLTWQQRQQLDTLLPTHYTVPTGSRLPIEYDADKPPLLAVRIQEMFGEANTPSIAQGRVPLVLSLLSPARRPLQITRDLSAFWKGAYAEVQKEMKGRYPKHPWPDDPASALPTRRTKKHPPAR